MKNFFLVYPYVSQVLFLFSMLPRNITFSVFICSLLSYSFYLALITINETIFKIIVMYFLKIGVILLINDMCLHVCVEWDWLRVWVKMVEDNLL
jgi:hypothetical protein